MSGACPSKDNVTWAQTCIHDGANGCIVAIVQPGGLYPYPDFEDFITGSCANSSILVCPFDMSEASQGCACTASNGSSSYGIDLLDESAGIVCIEDDTSLEDGTAMKPENYAFSVAMMHKATWERIIDLCGSEALAVLTWPHFYHFYNTPQGQAQIDPFLAQTVLPPAAVAALKTNYTDDIQRLYGMLNGYDWETARNSYWFKGQGAAPPQGWTDTTAYGAFMQLIDPGHWITQGGPGRDGLAGMDLLKVTYLRKTLKETYNYKSSGGMQFGNPFWNAAEWQEAYRQAIGVDKLNNPIGNAKDFFDEWAQSFINAGLGGPGQSADHYFDPPPTPGLQNPYDDKDFSGNLPALVPWENVQPYIHRETLDPTGHGYVNKCDSDDLLAKILPVAAGVLGGGVLGMIVPGEVAKFGSFVVGGFACYSVVNATYGEQANYWYDTTKRINAERDAALALSVGLPVCLMGGLMELGFAPEVVLNHKIVFFGGIGAVSYALLFPVVNQTITDGGAVLHFLLAPVNAVSGIFHNIFDGCEKHTTHFGVECYCEDANDKPQLITAIVQDLWGTTGEQQVLRTQCMEAALTTGSWGKDPVNLGTCDTSNGWMDTPTACVSAGEWAYEKWQPEIDVQCSQMHGEFVHCADMFNPSMIPARLPSDQNCVQQFGKYARQGGQTAGYGVAGKCYDFRAPLGAQELGTSSSYDWSKTPIPPKNNSECSIL